MNVDGNIEKMLKVEVISKKAAQMGGRIIIFSVARCVGLCIFTVMHKLCLFVAQPYEHRSCLVYTFKVISL